jgi:hypothetical protein
VWFANDLFLFLVLVTVDRGVGDDEGKRTVILRNRTLISAKVLKA